MIARIAAMIGWAGRAFQRGAFGDTDAVLRADAASHRRDQGQHGVVDLEIVWRWAQDVDVEVAVAEVPEAHHTRTGCHLVEAGAHRLLEVDELVEGQRHIKLVGDPRCVDRFGVTLSVGPETLATRRVDRDRGRLVPAGTRRGHPRAHRRGDRRCRHGRRTR